MVAQEALSVLKLRLQYERHVVHARQRARDIAVLLGFDRQEQVRLATATSELARNAFRYARDGEVAFSITGAGPQSFEITVTDAGPGIEHLQDILDGRYRSKSGMGKGLAGTRRLMDSFTIASSPAGTTVQASKRLPSTAPVVTAARVRAIAASLANADTDPFEEVERQNQELLRTLAELREKQDQLTEVNNELADTNRGVVALYAELEQNANDLRRISDLKTSFLSNLSHEFRTPLNAILALTQLLADKSDGDLSPEQEKQVSYIRKSAADLSELVNDLLDLAKVEAGKLEVRARAFAVGDLFGALRGMLRSLLSGNAVELSFHAPEEFPQFFTDESKVSQILRNLISNALKFTERGSVRVSVELEGDQAVFRVCDTGLGIAPEDQERIFEEFEQVQNDIQSRVRGTGLGLPLARKLARLLGGSLSVESTPGQGSAFSARIALCYSEAAKIEAPKAVRAPGKLLVLIVEDNLETRFVHQSALKTSPYTLEFARNLTEARTVLSAVTPDAIVLDRLLDGEDSLAFMQELKDGGYAGRFLVVSVLGDAIMPAQAGADAFLRKPFEPGALSRKLTELLSAASSPLALLVDDDEIHRYVLREALEPFHFRIVEANSGREALECAKKEPPSVIFLDVTMPGLTGLETLRELKNSDFAARVPVIIHTSRELSAEELHYIRGSGALFYPKPALARADAAESLRAALAGSGVL